jgi:hypothetical protein
VEQLQSHIYEEGLPIMYEEMRKYFPIYEEAVIVIYDFATCSILNFLKYEENLIFFFLSV